MTTGLALADTARIALIGIGVVDDRTSVVWDVPVQRRIVLPPNAWVDWPFSAGWKLPAEAELSTSTTCGPRSRAGKTGSPLLVIASF